MSISISITTRDLLALCQRRAVDLSAYPASAVEALRVAALAEPSAGVAAAAAAALAASPAVVTLHAGGAEAAIPLAHAVRIGAVAAQLTHPLAAARDGRHVFGRYPHRRDGVTTLRRATARQLALVVACLRGVSVATAVTRLPFIDLERLICFAASAGIPDLVDAALPEYGARLAAARGPNDDVAAVRRLLGAPPDLSAAAERKIQRENAWLTNE
jgi:hypothetical protein